VKTCSKENGQRLAELGVKVESYFSWYHDGKSLFIADTDTSMDFMLDIACIAPAYTACEFGEMLPDEIFTYRDKDGWNCESPVYENIDDQLKLSKTEADAKALMLIWLLEQNYITADQINKEKIDA